MGESLYRKMSARKKGNAYVQNIHIAEGYEDMNDALVALMHADIVVLDAHLGGSAPLINVQYNNACEGISIPTIGKRVVNSEGSFLVFTTLFHNCRVQWARPGL